MQSWLQVKVLQNCLQTKSMSLKFDPSQDHWLHSQRPFFLFHGTIVWVTKGALVILIHLWLETYDIGQAFYKDLRYVVALSHSLSPGVSQEYFQNNTPEILFPDILLICTAKNPFCWLERTIYYLYGKMSAKYLSFRDIFLICTDNIQFLFKLYISKYVALGFLHVSKTRL
jgi:hypothetical protein